MHDLRAQTHVLPWFNEDEAVRSKAKSGIASRSQSPHSTYSGLFLFFF